MMEEKKRPNLLLHGFILLSLCIHVLVFFHIAGIYESRAISYIELSMHQISKPDVRMIPKPRMREKAPEISVEKTVKVQKFHVPNIKMGVVENYKVDQSHKKISLPLLPDHMDAADFSVPGLRIQNQVTDMQTHEEHIEFTSAKEYFEMLNLRINYFKKYPEFARSRHIQGRVTVEFVLNRDGALSGIKIIKSSRYKKLDQAALEAVSKASPFPRPPHYIFTPPVRFQISIQFELA
ncbi:MAG: energy transducer TonB [Desulfobacula sp.]|nr:energy transducer TonB [Desulfobacula sp.]